MLPFSDTEKETWQSDQIEDSTKNEIPDLQKRLPE